MHVEARAAKRKRHVLVVDDDDLVRGFMVEALEELGCEVVEADCADVAVREYLDGSFDLITLDYAMPGLDGRALHRVLSQEFGVGKRAHDTVGAKLPPVLLVTAYAEEPDVLALARGEAVAGVVRKPFSVAQFREVVGSVLGDIDGA